MLLILRNGKLLREEHRHRCEERGWLTTKPGKDPPRSRVAGVAPFAFVDLALRSCKGRSDAVSRLLLLSPDARERFRDDCEEEEKGEAEGEGEEMWGEKSSSRANEERAWILSASPG